MADWLVGKFACRHCHHDQHKHNLMVGCPFCKCMATPSEASPLTDLELERPILSEHQHLHSWQKPDPKPEPKSEEKRRMTEEEAQAVMTLVRGGWLRLELT